TTPSTAVSGRRSRPKRWSAPRAHISRSSAEALHPPRSSSRPSQGGSPMKLHVNGAVREVDAPAEMPLLWVLRDLLGYTGTKFGCGMAQCGACTVHLDGQPTRSCTLPVSAVGEKKITTIEGLSPDGSHPVQQAWAAIDVVQCGYCQSGQIMCA